jgi:hypothetical protein
MNQCSPWQAAVARHTTSSRGQLSPLSLQQKQQQRHQQRQEQHHTAGQSCAT